MVALIPLYKIPKYIDFKTTNERRLKLCGLAHCCTHIFEESDLHVQSHCEISSLYNEHVRTFPIRLNPSLHASKQLEERDNKHFARVWNSTRICS